MRPADELAALEAELARCNETMTPGWRASKYFDDQGREEFSVVLGPGKWHEHGEMMGDSPEACEGIAFLRNALPRILAALAQARTDRAEIERLKRGEFTPEEFQGLCHHRDERHGCKAAEFFQGCEDYQRKLFGYAEADEMRKAINLLSREGKPTTGYEVAAEWRDKFKKAEAALARYRAAHPEPEVTK